MAVYDSLQKFESSLIELEKLIETINNQILTDYYNFSKKIVKRKVYDSLISDCLMLDEICLLVCRFTHVNKQDMLNSTRLRPVVNARHIFFLYAYKELYEKGRMTTIEIGKYLNKEHATVCHAVNKYDNDYYFKDQYDKFIKFLLNN